jgi:glycine betaine/choline ABC-type transport system substrate-binding protein
VRASSTLKLSLATVVFIAACGDSKSSETSVALKPKITISSTTDPTSETIAEIYGQALEKAEYRVARKKAYANSGDLLTALDSGDVQLSGMTTQALFGLVQTPSATPPAVPNTTAAQTESIAKLLPTNLKMGVPTSAEDKDIVFCAKTFADTNSIVTLTDLGTKPGIATLAAPTGFETSTPLGSAGLKQLYNIDFKAVVPTTIDKVVAAVNAGTADCGVGRSADPVLGVATLTILQDDKALVPDDVIVPVYSTQIGSDDILSVIDDTSARLTPDSLRAIEARLKTDGASPEIVANEFIGTAGVAGQG